MSDQLRQRTRPIEWFMAGTASVGTLGVLGYGILWLTGTWAGPINTRLELFSRQMDQFQSHIEMLPRADQLASVEGHAHALDGRMDALESRLRGDELDVARTMQRVEAIERSSNVGLGADRVGRR
jgi:hypothetical protein